MNAIDDINIENTWVYGPIEETIIVESANVVPSAPSCMNE